MPVYHDSIVIDAPPDEVFRFMENISNASKWMPDAEHVELVVDAHEDSDCCRFHETRRMGKRRISALVEVTRGRAPEAESARELRHLSVPSAVATYQFTIAEPESASVTTEESTVSMLLGREQAHVGQQSHEPTSATRVDLNATVEPEGILGRLFTGRFLRELQAADAAQLSRLKGAIESERLVEHLGPL